jgi:hypothetical protein
MVDTSGPTPVAREMINTESIKAMYKHFDKNRSTEYAFAVKTRKSDRKS